MLINLGAAVAMTLVGASTTQVCKHPVYVTSMDGKHSELWCVAEQRMVTTTLIGKPIDCAIYWKPRGNICYAADMMKFPKSP
jgi:hypothetical protein